MISQKAINYAEKCRFCWMCRHLCPVQEQTGREINTPRAKGLLLSMEKKGTAEADSEMARAMFECLLCEACTDNCATNYDPTVFIREARAESVADGTAPETVMELVRRTEETETVFSGTKTDFSQDGTEILVYIGETASFCTPEVAEHFLAVLKTAGVSARVLREEPVSGAMLAFLIGYTKEVEEQAAKCALKLNETGLPVVVLDSEDAAIMKHQYPEWGIEIKAGVTTATEYLAEMIRNGRIDRKEKRNEKAVVHDDDRLARTLHEFDPIREAVNAAGFTVLEMFRTRELAKSAGNTVFREYDPELAKKIAAGRWEDVKRTEAKLLVVSGPSASYCLKDLAPDGYQVKDVFEILL